MQSSLLSITCFTMLSRKIESDCAISLGAPDFAAGAETGENSKLIAQMPSSGVAASGCTSSPVIPHITFVFPSLTRTELSAVWTTFFASTIGRSSSRALPSGRVFSSKNDLKWSSGHKSEICLLSCSTDIILLDNRNRTQKWDESH